MRLLLYPDNPNARRYLVGGHRYQEQEASS